ncbi:tetratricopeptide repeat protein [Pelagicoccus enzymogenes]|uniref:tetratricopeptide repeat protein n=1 Tax=Pelagicoccus enzymogenes TaxID=2773457 RepID=UPI00280EC455|nr:tetratricopeptide repeat protein [Pelagicoccus enzymogenes]MDQ8197642.1 tetratricopeptide repeat protein [Pelagicoccus enzymogenes]
MKRLISVTVLVTVSVFASAAGHAGEIDDLRNAVETEDWAKAKSIGEALTGADGGSGEAYYLFGKALIGLKENEAAVAALEKANRLVKDNADYLADYGYALILRGQEMNMFQAGPVYMRAMDQYKAAVKADPDHLGAHIGLSRYYMNAPAIGGGSMKKAKEHAAQIARINPYMGHLEAALIAEKEKRFDDAIAAYDSAIALKSDEAWVYFKRGTLQQANGKVEDARASFEKTLAIDPDHSAAQAALAGLE